VRDNNVLMREYATDAATLWAALKRALRTVDGITLEQADDAEHTAIFKTGVTWTSWGQNMVASVEALGEQAARLHVSGQIRHTFLATNWGEELHQKTFARSLTEGIDHALRQR
jgi:Ser/Thr protein kinase RdoA (MazF antagonist)